LLLNDMMRRGVRSGFGAEESGDAVARVSVAVT